MSNLWTKSLAPKKDFDGLIEKVYLAAGQAGPPLKIFKKSFDDYMYSRKKGVIAKKDYDDRVQIVKSILSTMLSATPDDIALVGNASQGINLIASAINLSSDENIVIEDTEYPSVVLPWLRFGKSRLKIANNSGRWGSYNSIASQVDTKTKVICISHVNFYSGYRHDLVELRRLADSVGAKLLIDASQSLGVVEVDSSLADFVFSSTHKWLLGPHGVGVVAWNRNRFPQLSLPDIGWHSVSDFDFPITGNYQPRNTARIFELGCLPYLCIYFLSESLMYLSQYSTSRIESHVLELGHLLISGLKKLGIEVLTPENSNFRAGNICFVSNSDTFLQQQLSARNIDIVSGYNRIRASIHIYNDAEDIYSLLSALEDIQSTIPLNNKG